MFVGQDPTRSERVKSVLMLDDKNSQLMRWLKGLFDDKFSCIDIYANIVKCSINYPPSTQAQGGLKFLKEFFTLKASVRQILQCPGLLPSRNHRIISSQ
jgi:hypothetical protein